MLSAIHDGFIDQWRGVGATEAELAEVVQRDGGRVLADMDHPNVARWTMLVALQQPRKTAAVSSSQSVRSTTKRSYIGKALSYGKSIVSRAVRGRVKLPVFQSRSNQCHGDGTTDPCPARAFNEITGHHWCTECGCGADVKLSQVGSTAEAPILIPAGRDYGDAPYLKQMHPYVECPRRRAGFSNAGSASSTG